MVAFTIPYPGCFGFIFVQWLEVEILNCIKLNLATQVRRIQINQPKWKLLTQTKQNGNSHKMSVACGYVAAEGQEALLRVRAFSAQQMEGSS